MEKSEIKNDRLPVMGFPWAIKVTGATEMVFVSGIPPMDDMRKVVGADALEQFEYEAQRIDEILGKAGMGLSDIVYLSVTVTEKARLYDEWGRFAEIYAKYFPNTPGPAGGTLRIVSGLSHPKMLVEVEAIAAR